MPNDPSRVFIVLDVLGVAVSGAPSILNFRAVEP